MGKGKDEDGKKKTGENDEEEAVRQIPLEQLKSQKKALEELKKILKIFDVSITTVYQKMEELEESHRKAKKEEPKGKEGEKPEGTKENVELLPINNEFRRIAYEFRHMEYYLWMNRANRELFENLEKLIKISTASEDGFSKFIELKGAKVGDGLLWKERGDMEEAILASRELAAILWQFVERLNLADVVKETIKVEMASPKAANESEERKVKRINIVNILEGILGTNEMASCGHKGNGKREGCQQRGGGTKCRRIASKSGGIE
jgi:hypothetical protein